MRIEENADRTLLIIDGPVRLGEVPGWLELVQRAAAQGRPVEIDLSAAQHMHTAAWQVLCSLTQEMRARSLPCRVRSMSPVASAACALFGLTAELTAQAS